MVKWVKIKRLTILKVVEMGLTGTDLNLGKNQKSKIKKKKLFFEFCPRLNLS